MKIKSIRNLYSVDPIYGEKLKEFGVAVLQSIESVNYQEHPEGIRIVYKYKTRQTESDREAVAQLQDTINRIDEDADKSSLLQAINRIESKNLHLLPCLYSLKTGGIHEIVTTGKNSKSKLCQSIKEAYEWAKEHKEETKFNDAIVFGKISKLI